jgi:DNA-binding transcriptional MerR regulator
MQNMLKIGEFSRLCQVTVKTLHHYDELGLIKPAHIDPVTSYRFYTVGQLPRIHRIMALKEMGLSLEQIGLMLENELSTDEMRGMLRFKQSEIQQEVREAQRQLAMVEFRLRMIEAEINFPILDVVIKRIEAMRYLSFFVDPPSSKKEAMGMAQVVKAIHQAIANGEIKHTGVSLDVFYGETILPLESPELQANQHEILIGVEKSQQEITIEGLGRLKVRDEPVIETAATLMLTGENNDRLQQFEKVTLLCRWAIAQGYVPRDLVRYWHHRGPLQTLNREEFVIEAQLPVDAGE